MRTNRIWLLLAVAALAIGAASCAARPYATGANIDAEYDFSQVTTFAFGKIRPKVTKSEYADTVQNGGYSIAATDPFDINLLAVYRQVIDLTNIEHAEWIVPGGVSALPGTPHYVDQLERWRVHERAAMPYADADIEAVTRHRLELRPDDGS